MEVLLNSSMQEVQQLKHELKLLNKMAFSIDSKLELANFRSENELLKNVSVDKIISSTTKIKEYRELLEAAVIDHIDVKDSRMFTNYFLSKLKLKCPDDFIESLTKSNEIVEAYSLDHVQVFRNFTFLKFCGYSLADVLTYEWPELFERSHIVTQQLLETVGKVLQTEKTVQFTTPVHYMKERFSESRRITKVDFQYLAPLFDMSGAIAGYVASSHVKLIDKTPENHDLRFI